MKGEIGDPKLTFLVEPLMSYKQNLSNNNFDLQLHYKATATFVGKEFFYQNKSDLNMRKYTNRFLLI